MNPLKHKLANEWMRQDDASPEEALETWNTMEAEFKANRAMTQEPRTMAQAPLANELEPGALRDEMLKGFDPSQETHEEYLQRINLERPFNAAHGGRIIGKPGGIVEPGIEYYGDNVITYTGQGKHKGKHHLRLGADKKIHRGSKEKLEKILERRKTAGGDVTEVLETKTYKKGWKTKKQFLKFLKKNHIAGENAGSFAGNFGINTKPNPYNKNAYIYDTSQFTPKKIEQIYKAQVSSGTATDYAKKLYPPKEKYEYTKKRYLAEKKAGGVKDSGWEGKKGSGVELGHGDDFWAHRKITPQNLLYTPTEINKLLGDKGMLDDKIYAVYEKQEKGKLTKKGDDLKKFLNETDATLTRLADQSGGFKQITLSNGGIYGGDKFSVDMFDEFKGMSQKEAVQFVNKWKDKKTWNTAEEFNNIKKAKLFEINRKNAYKAALKMSQKDKTKIMEKIKGGDFQKTLFKTYQNAGIGKNCKAYGGRVGFQDAGAVGVSKCMNNAIQEHNKNLQSKDISVKNAARAKQYGILKNANKIKGMKNLFQMGRKGFQAITGTVGTATGGWGGVALEAAIEGLFYEHYRRKGYNDKQAQAETFFYKMMDPDRETGVWEGAEQLLEDELVGKRDEEGYLKSAQPHKESWFDVGADKYQTQLNAMDSEIAYNDKLNTELSLMTSNKLRTPTPPEVIKAKEQEINDSYDRLDELQITLKQGTPEQEAYVRAEEKQKALQDERAQKHWGDTPAYKAGKRKQWKDEFLEYKQAKPRYRKDKPYAFRESEIEANIGPEKGYILPWEKYFPRSVDDPRTTEQQKWDYIYNQGGFDLTDRIGVAGGVSKMATGGIMNLKKKW